MTDLRIHPLPRPGATLPGFLAWTVAGRAAAWLAAFTPGGKPHRYTSCRDRDCERVPCLAYREGFDDGWAEGFAAGRGES